MIKKRKTIPSVIKIAKSVPLQYGCHKWNATYGIMS